MRRLALAMMLALAVGGAGLAASLSPGKGRAARFQSQTPDTQPAWVTTALKRLGALKVKPAASMDGYSRGQFGPAWQDVDHNGCDARHDILRRDLKNETLKDMRHCVVLNGTLHDPYSGQIIHFVRGVKTSSAVQIDHVVALGDAWRTGAGAWKAARRLAYANDPVVLLAVDGPENEAKGDDDASEWQPPSPCKCHYVAKQLAIQVQPLGHNTRTRRDADATHELHPTLERQMR